MKTNIDSWSGHPEGGTGSIDGQIVNVQSLNMDGRRHMFITIDDAMDIQLFQEQLPDLRSFRDASGRVFVMVDELYSFMDKAQRGYWGDIERKVLSIWEDYKEH